MTQKKINNYFDSYFQEQYIVKNYKKLKSIA